MNEVKLYNTIQYNDVYVCVGGWVRGWTGHCWGAVTVELMSWVSHSHCSHSHSHRHTHPRKISAASLSSLTHSHKVVQGAGESRPPPSVTHRGSFSFVLDVLT